MLTKHPLFRRFERRVSLWGQELEWREENRDLFLRPVEEKVDVVWCRPFHVLGWIGHRLQPQRSQFNPNLKYWREHFPYRFCPISRTTELFLRDGHGFYRSSAFGRLLRFELPHQFLGSGDPLTMNAPEIRRLIAGWKDSDEFALLETLALQGRSGLSWLEWERGSWHELEPLLRALFVLVDGRFRFVPDTENQNLNFKSALEIAWPNKKLRSGKFAQVLSLFFEARTSRDLKRLYREPELPATAPMIELKSPPQGDISQHERLEALFVWRDFLRGKIPDAEIKSLLNPNGA